MIIETKPDRVVIVRPTPENELPNVEIFYKGKSVGITEIIHCSNDPNTCFTRCMYSEKETFYPKFTLQDIENLTPEDVSYLIPIENGMYRNPTIRELRDEGWI